MIILFRRIIGLTVSCALLGVIVVAGTHSDALASAHSAPPRPAPASAHSDPPKRPFEFPPAPGIRDDPWLDRGVSHTAPPFDPRPPWPDRGRNNP